MPDIVYIYALCEPDTEEIRYIGAAKDVRKRTAEHIHAARAEHRTTLHHWILSLDERLPVVILLDETTEPARLQVEREWIKLYRDKGARLVNGKHVEGVQTDKIIIKHLGEQSIMTEEEMRVMLSKAHAVIANADTLLEEAYGPKKNPMTIAAYAPMVHSQVQAWLQQYKEMQEKEAGKTA